MSQPPTGENNLAGHLIPAAIGIILLVILSIMGSAMSDATRLTQGIDVDNETEWTQLAASQNNVQVNPAGYLELSDGASTGTYTSNSANSNVNTITFDVDIPDNNSTVNVTIGGNEYQLTDGENTITFENPISDDSFELELTRPT